MLDVGLEHNRGKLDMYWLFSSFYFANNNIIASEYEILTFQHTARNNFLTTQ